MGPGPDVNIHLQVAVAPDGNGGIYQALLTSNVRTDMRKRGIQHIHAYCVDNCLAKVADPVFLGFSTSKDVDIATKVVRKRSAKEPVGLILLKNGKPDVVEYSEIDTATAEAKDPKQPEILKFRAANIVNHYYSFRFLETIEEWAHELPHHVARKKIPYVDIENGETIKPEKPNGIKLEQFVFDVFPMLDLKKFASMEVKREDEFSPLKNAKGTGEDDPDTSKKDILDQGKRWIETIGGTVVSESGADEAGVEVSPLISYVCQWPRALDRTITDSPNRAVRVFAFSKTGQSKLLPLSRRSPRSNGEVCTTALPLQHRRQYAYLCLKEIHYKDQTIFMEASIYDTFEKLSATYVKQRG